MKKLIVCLLVMCSLQAFADKKYNALFSSAVKADSLDRAAEILKDWELNGPKDGDYYAAHYNLRFNKAIAVGIGQSDVRPLYAQDAMVMTDTAGNVAGYMFQKIAVTDYVMLDSAFAWLNKGIALFPQRLDLWIGLTSTFWQLDDAESLVETLNRLAEWKAKNKKVLWTWTSDEAIEDQSAPFESVLQDYFGAFYDYPEAYFAQASQVADIGVALCPKSAVFYNDQAAIAYARGEYKEALALFKKALKCSPDDELIQQNIEYLKGMTK